MKLVVEDYDGFQEVMISDIELYGHFDEHLFVNALYWNGIDVRAGQFGFELTIPTDLHASHRSRSIEVLKRYGFSSSEISQISALCVSALKSISGN